MVSKRKGRTMRHGGVGKRQGKASDRKECGFAWRRPSELPAPRGFSRVPWSHAPVVLQGREKINFWASFLATTHD